MTAALIILGIYLIVCALLMKPVMDASGDGMEALTKVILWPYFLMLAMAVNTYRITKDYLK